MDRGQGGPYDEAMAGATFDLVTHDDAQPTPPAVRLEGRVTLPYGALAELAANPNRYRAVTARRWRRAGGAP
jgi:hypothetical protein